MALHQKLKLAVALPAPPPPAARRPRRFSAPTPDPRPPAANGLRPTASAAAIQQPPATTPEFPLQGAASPAPPPPAPSVPEPAQRRSLPLPTTIHSGAPRPASHQPALPPAAFPSYPLACRHNVDAHQTAFPAPPTHVAHTQEHARRALPPLQAALPPLAPLGSLSTGMDPPARASVPANPFAIRLPRHSAQSRTPPVEPQPVLPVRSRTAGANTAASNRLPSAECGLVNRPPPLPPLRDKWHTPITTPTRLPTLM